MKSNKTKSAMTALVVAAMLCSAAMPIRAAEAQWVNNNGTWSYVKEDGSIAKGWIKDNNCWYAFDDNGAMRTGWIASNEHWYFMGESGVMQADAWVEDNGARYYIKGTGVMAKDYVKDGYELTVDGKAIPLAESKSVVLTDPEALEGEVIEGNLYVDVTTAKALELKGVTVKGKLVVIGDNKTAGKLTITDSKIEAISTQTRNTEVVLSGETEVKTIVLEETAAVTPDKNFKGEVEKIEVQSTTKGEVVIEVPAQEVSTRTYASVDIQAPVESLEVKTDTQIKVNADVKNVVVTESAKDTKVEVSKGSTVGTITANAPVKIEGNGTINKVEANVDGVEAGKDTVIKDVETGKDVEKAPEVNKPSTGGSTGGSSSGGSETRPTVNKLTVEKITGLSAPAAAVKNQNAITVKFEDNVYKVRSNNTLESYASSNTEQGEGKWIGFVLDTGESSIIGLSVDTGNGWYAFTEADVAEAATVGASEGKFVFWMKAEEPNRSIKVKKGTNGIEKTVTIKYNSLVDLATQAKDRLKNIQESNLNMDWDTVITAAYYQSELSAAAVTDNSLTETLNTLNNYYKSITELDLSGENTSQYDISTGALTMFTGLKELNLSGTGISELGGLVGLTNLEKLDISNNRLTTATNDDRLGALANLTSLNELNLSNNKGITALSAIAGLSELTTLDISSTSITDFNVFWNESAARFANLTYLKATNIQGLESIAGLVEIVKEKDFSSDGKTWNLSGSTLKEDKDNHIKAISDKFTDGSFIAPTISTTSEDNVKDLGEISLKPNGSGEHTITFTPFEEAENYEFVLLNNYGYELLTMYSEGTEDIDKVTLEELVTIPPIETIQSLNVLTIEIRALNNNDDLLAKGSLNISFKTNVDNVSTSFTAMFIENGVLEVELNSSVDLSKANTVEIFTKCTCHEGESRRTNIYRAIPEDFVDNKVSWLGKVFDLNVHTTWESKVILDKCEYDQVTDTYTINITQLNNGNYVTVTMPTKIE